MHWISRWVKKRFFKEIQKEFELILLGFYILSWEGQNYSTLIGSQWGHFSLIISEQNYSSLIIGWMVA